MLQSNIEQAAAWQFALTKYSEPDVSKACLLLQDKHQCNVNVLLFCVYLHSIKVTMDTKAILVLIQAIAVSEQQLSAHRQLRRRAKTQNAETYQRLLADELSLELAQHKLVIETANSEGIQIAEEQFCALKRYLRSNNVNHQQIEKFCDIINR